MCTWDCHRQTRVHGSNPERDGQARRHALHRKRRSGSAAGRDSLSSSATWEAGGTCPWSRCAQPRDRAFPAVRQRTTLRHPVHRAGTNVSRASATTRLSVLTGGSAAPEGSLKSVDPYTIPERQWRVQLVAKPAPLPGNDRSRLNDFTDRRQTSSWCLSRRISSCVEARDPSPALKV